MAQGAYCYTTAFFPPRLWRFGAFGGPAPAGLAAPRFINERGGQAQQGPAEVTALLGLASATAPNAAQLRRAGGASLRAR